MEKDWNQELQKMNNVNVEYFVLKHMPNSKTDLFDIKSFIKEIKLYITYCENQARINELQMLLKKANTAWVQCCDSSIGKKFIHTNYINKCIAELEENK